MMTAAQIASKLGVKEVTINYRATETLHKYLYLEDPMPNLQFSKADCDFNRLLYTQSQFAKFFPEEISIKEPKSSDPDDPKGPIDYKEAIFNVYPEDEQSSQLRAVRLFEYINRRIAEEAEELGRKKVCYLVITHGSILNEIGNIYDILANDATVAKSDFAKLNDG